MSKIIREQFNSEKGLKNFEFEIENGNEQAYFKIEDKIILSLDVVSMRSFLNECLDLIGEEKIIDSE